MKRVKFSNLEVTYNNGEARIIGDFEGSSFDNEEVKMIVGAILSHLTDKGDGYGGPIRENVFIQNSTISGKQNK